ncbi:hypothetical protein I3W98_24575, partial [Streptomyces cavourensis]|nr:hypothetical protein [Streptomyces cavourensis]
MSTPVASLRGPARVVLRLHRRTLWAAGAAVAVGIAGLVAVALLADRAAADLAGAGCTLSSDHLALVDPRLELDRADRQD